MINYHYNQFCQIPGYLFTFFGLDQGSATCGQKIIFYFIVNTLGLSNKSIYLNEIIMR